MGKQFELAALSTCQPNWVQEVANSYATDANAQERLQQLAIHSPDDQGYELYRGIIRRQGRLWIGANSALRTKLIAALHCSAVGGHSGSTATYQRVRKHFDWRGLKRDVAEFVQQCTMCQQAKHEHVKPAGLLAPLPIPTAPWQDLTMDFVEGLPRSEEHDTIMVVVDRFTKFAHFVPLRHPFNAKQVPRAFWENVVKLHGIPVSIVSDRDKIFTSHLWRELLAGAGTKLLYSTAYHPQTDGQSERVNQCMEMYLRCAVQDSPHQWRRWLPMAEFWYNSTFHASLKGTPFKALYGTEANLGAMASWAESAPAGEELDWAAHTAHSWSAHSTDSRRTLTATAQRGTFRRANKCCSSSSRMGSVRWSIAPAPSSPLSTLARSRSPRRLAHSLTSSTCRQKAKSTLSFTCHN